MPTSTAGSGHFASFQDSINAQSSVESSAGDSRQRWNCSSISVK